MNEDTLGVSVWKTTCWLKWRADKRKRMLEVRGMEVIVNRLNSRVTTETNSETAI